MSSGSFPAIASALWTCVVIAVATSSAAYTVTHTELFRPLREGVRRRLGHMIGYLFTCFYCMSHWVAFAGVLIYRPVLVDSGFLVVDLLVAAFFTLTLSTLMTGLLFKVFHAAIAVKLEEQELKQGADED